MSLLNLHEDDAHIQASDDHHFPKTGHTLDRRSVTGLEVTLQVFQPLS